MRKQRHSALVFASRIVNVQSFFFLNKNFMLLAFFCDCTGRFVSDLFGNPKDMLSCVVAQSKGLYNQKVSYRYGLTEQ